MKTRILLLLLSVLNILASDLSVRVERGINVIRTWTDGVLSSEIRQTLSDCTNLFQQEKYIQDCSGWTQKLYQAWYSGNGTMMLKEGWTLEWECNGNMSSNRMDPEGGIWTTFTSGGSQGAMTVVNGNERTQIINASALRAEWKTNGTPAFSCPAEDDQGTMIFWYRTNSQAGLPWFIGTSCELVPGERKSIQIQTPVDCIWHFMGTDKCIRCGEPCWLAGWPQPSSRRSGSLSTGRPLQLSFSGTPGATYALQESFNLRDWTVLKIVEPDGQGGTVFILPDPAGTVFFRVQAVSTVTMNEEETRLAVEELRQFNNQP